MSQPRTSLAYPPSFQTAVEQAFKTGELSIPHPKPMALRLQFQGLRGALRREGTSDLIDSLGFYIQIEPPALILRVRENSPDALAVQAALENLPGENSPVVPSPVSSLDADEALKRILGNI